jgi:type I restriction enzyme S subunit
METKLLGDFDIYINDGNYGNIYPKKSEFLDSGIPFISATDFKGRVFNFKDIKYINRKHHFDVLTKGHIKLNDVIIVVRGNGIGKVGYFKDEIGECNMNAQLAFIRTNPEELNSAYLYYLFSGKDYLNLIKRFGTGSAQPQLPINRLKLVPVISKDIKTQKQIAKVLSDLDAKIEINNKINQELEAMAKTLYDYWFVQFDFPDKNEKSYKSSGGEMVFNEALKREIPVGWEIGTILDCADLVGGGTPKKEISEYWNGEIPFFTPTDTEDNVFCLKTILYTNQLGINKSSTKLFDKGTILITARGTVGKINIAGKPMAMNQSCYALVPKTNVSSEFVYFHTSQIVRYLKAKSSGSIFKAIVTNDFNFTPTIVPNIETIEAYSKKTNTMFEMILSKKNENQKLSELRDWLLPMLMNGQVSVGYAEQEVESLGLVAGEDLKYKHNG